MHLDVPGVDDGRPALVLLTSGSTGRPKGVALTHDGGLGEPPRHRVGVPLRHPPDADPGDDQAAQPRSPTRSATPPGWSACSSPSTSDGRSCCCARFDARAAHAAVDTPRHRPPHPQPDDAPDAARRPPAGRGPRTGALRLLGDRAAAARRCARRSRRASGSPSSRPTGRPRRSAASPSRTSATSSPAGARPGRWAGRSPAWRCASSAPGGSDGRDRRGRRDLGPQRLGRPAATSAPKSARAGRPGRMAAHRRPRPSRRRRLPPHHRPAAQPDHLRRLQRRSRGGRGRASSTTPPSAPPPWSPSPTSGSARSPSPWSRPTTTPRRSSAAPRRRLVAYKRPRLLFTVPDPAPGHQRKGRPHRRRAPRRDARDTGGLTGISSHARVVTREPRRARGVRAVPRARGAGLSGRFCAPRRKLQLPQRRGVRQPLQAFSWSAPRVRT